MSSSDESEAAAPQNRRKRKSRRLVIDDSDGSPELGRRRSNRVNVAINLEDSSSSDSDNSVVMVKRKKVARVQSDSDDSSSSDSIIVRRSRNVAPLTEDSDSQWETDFTTDHEIDNTRNTVEKPSSSSLIALEEKAIAMDSDESDGLIALEEKAIAMDSDSSDGLSEKCPICLVSFRLQEIGVPESCEHIFCLECIQEWSKNINTCPVDRKEYNSISVKKSIDGAVDRKIGVEKPQVQNEMDIVEDPTFCEICGSNDNEDRLLLCDVCRRRFHLRCVPGAIEATASQAWRCNACVEEAAHNSGCNQGYHLHCLNPPLEEVPFGSWYCQDCLQNNEEVDDSDLDSSASDIAYSDAEYDLEAYIGCDLGFHLYCLTPPLQEVPEGAWFCNDCSPDDPLESELRVDELFRLLDEANLMFGRAVGLMNPAERRRGAARLLPRTTQVERIRRRIANNRRPNNVTEPGPSTSSGRARSSRNITASTTTRPKKTKRRKKSKRTTISYKTVYEIDEVTGEAVAVKKRVKTKKKKSRTKRKNKQSTRVNTNKRPTAGCRPDASNFDKNEQRRHNAGIPSLDLFGNTNRLDYFSDSEGEDHHNSNGQGILLTRTAQLASTANAIRRVTRRKNMLLETPSSISSATDILGSIMETQEKFLSKNAVLTVVDSSGKLEIQQKGGQINENNNIISSTSGSSDKSTKTPVASRSDDRVDVNSSDFSTREAVFGSRRGGRNRGGGFRGGSGGYNTGGSHYNRRHDEAPSYSSNSGGGGPVDFSHDSFNDGPPGGSFGRGRPPMRLGDGDFNTPQDYTRRTLLERENFDRPRRDDRNERNFPPRFQDDFRRPPNERDIPDDFRRPPNERDVPDDFRRPLNERDFPPRFEDEFRRDRGEYSPPPFHEDDEREPSPRSFHENNDRYHDDRRDGDNHENSLRPPNFQRRRSAEFESDGSIMRPSSEFESGPPRSVLAPPPPPPPSGFPPNLMSSGPPSLLSGPLPSILSSASIPPPPLFPGASGPGSLFPIGGPPTPLFPVGGPPTALFPVGGPPDFQHGPPNFTSGPPSDFPMGPPPPPNFEQRPPQHFESGPPHYESGPLPHYESGPPLDFESAPQSRFEYEHGALNFESGAPPGFQSGPPSNFESGPPPNFDSGLQPNFQSGPPPNFESGPPPNFESGPPPNFESGPLPNFESGPPPNFESGPPPHFESGPSPHFESGPPPNFESGPPINFESGPPPEVDSGPLPNFECEPLPTFESGPPPTFESGPSSTFESGQPPNFESCSPNFESGSPSNFVCGSPPDNAHAGNLVLDPADYESVPPIVSLDSLSNNQEQTHSTPEPCTVSEPDFTSDSPPRNGSLSTQSYSQDEKQPQVNSAPPETYMPNEPYMPSEPEEKSLQKETRNKSNDNLNGRENYGPDEAPDEYNPEECTQGSDNEVDIYSDIEEEQSKRPNNPENTMLPPTAPPISGINRAITPSSVPYTPSKPLSPRAWSPKRPYSPPRSYSPSFPTSPPRTLNSDIPYTPSKTFSPNRTPERPSQVEPSTGQPYSPTANSDVDSENEMVIDTEKVQEEHREEQSTTDDKALEGQAVNKVDNGNELANDNKAENGDKPEDDQCDPHDENWEKDSDDGKKLSENMWDETPSVHKPKSWDEETPSFSRPKTSNWENETPALHPRPPPKSIWEREEDELGDGCPNFSIYSRQSKSVALTTDLTISQTKELLRSHTPPTKSSGTEVETTFGYGSDPRVKILKNTKLLSGLYSDSEDESVVKKSAIAKPKGPTDKMTEDIVSEEERSYTPCRDENSAKQGLEGLDTEMVSEDERNEFEATTADGDALEINAKDSELDLTRPQDCEEGEILDKSDQNEEAGTPKEKTKKKKKDKAKDKSVKEKSNNKENDPKESFKKISRSNKDRNYRGDHVRSKSPKSKEKTKSSKDKSKEKKRKEKRREIERYDVRAVVSERPKKDAFGRDIPEKSRSRSYTPPLIARLFNKSLERRSLTPKRRTRSPTPPRRLVRDRSRSKRRSKSRGRKRDKSKRSRSRSRSRIRRKDKSKNKKRKRSPSKSEKRREGKNKRRARGRSKTPSRPTAREWTPSLSPSPIPMRMTSPSWTPPRATDPHLEELRDVINESLTVMLDNTSGRPRRERNRREKRRDKTSRRRRERTPPPSKEVFASGDNILVSVSFNNENEDTRNKKRQEDKEKKKRRKEKRKNKNKNTAGVKPVAIIDLDRSPFLEVPVSPKEVIVLSDSDHQDAEASNMEAACDSSQQVASPEVRNNFSMGPKTPPEPQVKFSLSTKPSQMRIINNPLHDPEEEHQEEPEEELNNSQTHKGPNTPPEPPSSPPSSPDAYDPFEPTKSRSVTPEPSQTLQSNVVDESHTTNIDSSSLDITEKLHKTPEVTKSVTPPMADVQPADSQSSIAVSPKLKSPEQRTLSSIVSQVIQATVTSLKPIAQTTPFSSDSTAMITSTPISTTVTTQRINILNSTVLTPTIPQRIVLPNQIKPSPVKISPTKAAVKSTPVKPMPKIGKITKKVSRTLNGSSLDDITIDLDSPYSPASSDYDDLFEPPQEVTKPKSSKIQQSHKSVFDTLFGSPSVKKKSSATKPSARKASSKTKHVGVKIDEDSLKIMDDLPNSAVEMQVKEKFLKKLNRQERVVEEVKLVLKPFYNKKRVTKEEYKEIMRRAVPKICHNKTGEINPNKIRKLVEAYVKKIGHNKKVTSSSSLPLMK